MVWEGVPDRGAAQAMVFKSGIAVRVLESENGSIRMIHGFTEEMKHGEIDGLLPVD